MQAILLLIVLTIGIYYRIHISPLHRWVLTGICTYSAVLVTNYELGRNTGIVANSIYDFVQRLSFTATEVIWTWAVWRWAALPARPAKLIPQEVYEEHSAGIHDRLRDLNDRLRVIFR
jgi:hypothetical protein